MVHHGKKLIFMHIPKSGGTPIRRLIETRGFECNQSYIKNERYGEFHRVPASYNLSDYKIFCFVRNPWDRLVSSYFWRKTVEKSKDNFYYTDTFNEFVEYTLNYDPSQEKYTKHFDQPLHLRSQYSIISDRDENSPVVDFIGRFETLQQDCIYYLKLHGFNVSQLESHNQSKRNRDYRIYYNYKTKKIVEYIYKEDIIEYGYEF